MQLSETSDFAGANWEAFAPTKQWASETEGNKTVFVRFRDSAGNISPTSHLHFLYDVNPPQGSVYIDNPWINQNITFAKINTFAFDGAYEYEGEYPDPGPYIGTVSDMRISTEPTFEKSVWQPYTNTITIPVNFAKSPSVYIQYRDSAGNVSETFSDTLKMDTTSPKVFAITEPGNELTRQIHVSASDDLSGLQTIYLSNDPLMFEGVASQAISDIYTWTFDTRRVVWIVAEDTAGNRSQPFPVHAIQNKCSLFLPITGR
jgi:hypothetical protein